MGFYRLGVLVMVASFGLGMGFLLLCVMVILFAPSAIPFLFPLFVPLIGVPLIVSGALLLLLYQYRVSHR